jgi:phosphoglycolate phosphatase
MNIKSIIFDLDGTLIDSIQDIADCTNEMLQNNGWGTYPVETYIGWIGNGARILIEKAVPDVKDPAIIDKLLAEYISIYTEKYNIKTRIYPGMDKFLDILVDKNIPFSILTNKPHAETLKIAGFYLKKWPFRHIFGQREGIPRKPNPQEAIRIAEDLNTEPGNTLFVGDSATDIKTAVAAGMLSVGVTWGYGTIESMKSAGASQLVDTAEKLTLLV